LNADLSAAPEIARLAMPLLPVQHDTAGPRTAGQLAGDLADLAASLERWWDLVRFDPDRPLRIPVPAAPGTWLLVAPPDTEACCDCRYATLLAGEAVETGSRGGRPLRPGRVRVHGPGNGHRLRTAGLGFSVTLHRGSAPSSGNSQPRSGRIGAALPPRGPMLAG
jgi:hypothetical protein